jgi:hypothetical protein
MRISMRAVSGMGWLLAAMGAGSEASAQRTTVPRSIGGIFRYAGDTLWVERDTTVERTIFRRDTVVRATFIDGRQQSQVTFLVVGDSARVLGAAGQDRTGWRPGMVATLTQLLFQRDELARAIRTAEVTANLRASMARMGRPPSATEPPTMPQSPLTYAVASGTRIVHHLDTLRYLRDVAGRTDTTIFLFIADTVVQRLSPTPRTFGLPMRAGLIGEMRMSLNRRQIAFRPSTLELPGPATDSGPMVRGDPSLPARTLRSLTGPLFRAHGDTISMFRDSTESTTIYGDTVSIIQRISGRIQTAQFRIVRGDSAYLIASVDSTRAQYPPQPVVGLGYIAMARTVMSSSALLSDVSPSGRNVIADRNAPPSSPSAPIRYCVAHGVELVQLGDTARYLRQRGVAVDTTIFVFTSDTTVRRLAPSPREFGVAMADGIRGDMRNVLTRRSLEATASSIMGSLPGATVQPHCYMR